MADINFRLLYLMDNPHGGNSVKVGTSGLEVFLTRFGNYQQGNGPDYTVLWPMCYIGEQDIINRLEERIKEILKQDRLESRLGEWYENYTAETIVLKIDDIIIGNHYKVRRLEDKFLPISYDNMSKMRTKMLEHYKKSSVSKDFLVG